MNDHERRDLIATLLAHRERLNAVVAGLDQAGLSLPTRNAEWTVRDVLAHVIASDQDLIALLQAASQGKPAARTHRQHLDETSRWLNVPIRMLQEELREQPRRWEGLLVTLHGPAFATHANVWWRSGPLAEVLADWRDHDRQHGEDIRLAIEQHATERHA